MTNGKHALMNVTNTLFEMTDTDHACVSANLDIPEMDKFVKVQPTVSETLRLLLITVTTQNYRVKKKNNNKFSECMFQT